MFIIYNFFVTIIKMFTISFTIVYALVTYADVPLGGSTLVWVVLLGAVATYLLWLATNAAAITNPENGVAIFANIIFALLYQIAGFIFIFFLIFLIFLKLDYHTFLYNGVFDQILLYSLICSFFIPKLFN